MLGNYSGKNRTPVVNSLFCNSGSLWCDSPFTDLYHNINISTCDILPPLIAGGLQIRLVLPKIMSLVFYFVFLMTYIFFLSINAQYRNNHTHIKIKIGVKVILA